MNNQGFWRIAKVKFYLNKERLFKDIMELDQKKSLSEEEAEELLKEDIEDFKQTVRDEKLRKEDLKQLYSLEKSGKERNSFLNFLVRFGKEDKVLRELDGFLEQVSRVDSAMDKIVTEYSESLEYDEIKEKTVKELKKYLKENKIPKDKLKEILEIEKNNKDRKTAKKYIRKEIKDSDSMISPSEVQKEISDLEDKVRSFKKDFIYHPDIFSLENLEKEFEEDSENRFKENKEDPNELVILTGKLANKLKKNDHIRNTEEFKELTEEAISMLESEDLGRFQHKLEEMNKLLGFDNQESESDYYTTEDKLDELEKAVDNLVKQEKELNAPKAKLGAVNNHDKNERREKIENLSSKGFDKSDLESRSSSDLEKLENSVSNQDGIEDKFNDLNSENNGEDGNANEKIQENIEELKNSLKN